MKPKLLSGVLIFSLALNLAVVGTFLFHRLNRPDFPPAFVRDRFFRALDIPKPKQDKLFSLMKSFRDETRPLQERIFENEKRLIEKVENGTSDSTEINAILDTLASLRLEQSKKAMEHFLKARTFLSPRQQKRLFGMILRMRPPRGKWMHRPPGFRRR